MLPLLEKCIEYRIVTFLFLTGNRPFRRRNHISSSSKKKDLDSSPEVPETMVRNSRGLVSGLIAGLLEAALVLTFMMNNRSARTHE